MLITTGGRWITRVGPWECECGGAGPPFDDGGGKGTVGGAAPFTG